ncbi:hypothetical protein SPHFLASMR4Y_01743 [Sphingorhabdus sp. SMR4y]|nr:hypothetical protein SPHFLASMR4Y_01743 [Sphingorhabdus sp. SMR4y]
MATNYHKHSPLIDAVGGEAVRKRLGITSQTLHNWRVRGVPILKRMKFAALATEQGVKLPDNFLGELDA